MDNKNIFKPIKTNDLIEERKMQLMKVDDNQQYENSRKVI